MRLLAYTSPAHGHLYPAVPILCELRRRGHEVAARTLAPELDAVAALGIAADSVSPDVEAIELDDYRARSQAARSRRALATFAARAEPEAPDMQAAGGASAAADALERLAPAALSPSSSRPCA
jgi:UDP:flavonoid glycosyltransferase YjiC (YdhE family)